MKHLVILINVILGIHFVSQSAWALHIVSPKEGDTVYAGENLTIIVKPDTGENWVAVFCGLDPMTYNPTLDEYTITIQVSKVYYGYDNLVIVAGDSSGNSIQLHGTVFVKLPPNVVLHSIIVDDYKTLFKLPIGSSPEDMQRIESRKLHVNGIYSDGVKRELTSSTRGTTYTSSNDKIVIVDSEGKMTAQGIGEAKITVRNGSYIAMVDVIVKPYGK